MTMTYASLTGSKSTSGSIASWVSYTRLDIEPIVAEAQTLIYSMLRVREMMTTWYFTIPQNGASIALPSRFLDPIGRIRFTSISTGVRHKDAGFVEQARNYNELSGTLGANALTTTSGSNLVSVNLPGNGFTQDSLFYISGAATFNGVSINGTFPIASITDANNFVIDIDSLGTTPSASGSGGGSAMSYVCDLLTTGMPAYYGISDERLKFEVALSQQVTAKLQHYQSLPLLSANNQSNFLTNRYPQLMRTACLVSVAEFMKDDTDYEQTLKRLVALVDRINVENDGQYRGMELDPEIP